MSETSGLDPDEYSSYEIHTLECAVCRKSARYIVWVVADTTSRPTIKGYVKSGSIHEVRCYFCGYRLDRPSHLLYCSPEEDKFFLWIPAALLRPDKELSTFVFEYFSNLPADYNAGRTSPVIVDKYVTDWKNAESYSIVCKVRDEHQFIKLVTGSSEALRSGDQAPSMASGWNPDVPTRGLASIAHPAADPDRAARLNREHIEALARWRALPRWKRFLTKKPIPPVGI
jgi:hypothetical protein